MAPEGALNCNTSQCKNTHDSPPLKRVKHDWSHSLCMFVCMHIKAIAESTKLTIVRERDGMFPLSYFPQIAVSLACQRQLSKQTAPWEVCVSVTDMQLIRCLLSAQVCLCVYACVLA